MSLKVPLPPTRALQALAFGMGLLTLAGAPLLAAAPAPAPATSRPGDPRLAFFEARVRPLLLQRCVACHSQKIAQGGLRLDTPAGLLKGGDAGPVVVPGKPEQSRLIEAVQHRTPKLQMPPAGKLPEAEIRLLESWVKDGAVMPQPAATGKSSGPMSIEEGRRFWAFQPLAAPAKPKVRAAAWPKRDLDHFVLAALEKGGQKPMPQADRRTLLRRVYFNLVGLPPTPEETEAFLADPDPKAYDKLVDRLLASPHYGERWGRHWLDLVRYCDVPESWAVTEAQPWLYRDWVVKALNDDLPYPEFVKRQLAVDEMPGQPPSELAALGFIGLSPSYWKELKLAPDVIKTVVAEEWEERINTVTGTVLGLTVACARCHDHKFDPITTQDYYALAGIFASTRTVPRPLLPEAQARQVLQAREQVGKMEAESKRLAEAAGKDAARAEELRKQSAAMKTQAEELRRSTPSFDAPQAYAVDTASVEVLPDGPDRTRVAYREGAGQDVPMQVRGNVARLGPVVPRRFLTVLTPGSATAFTQGSGRRELAEAMFREGGPLSARVIVNRVWKHHFGKGLVETPSNFGVQGERPSNPELLEDLTRRFVAAGWSLKWLHREIMLSATFQQTAAAPGSRNPLAGRRRLEVEAWRDSILAAAGTLDRKLGGAPQELSAPTHNRRTLYGTVKRRELDDLLRLYDFPDPTGHSPARFHTTTPLQQLYVLNSEFIGRQATALARRVRSEAPAGAAAQVERAYRLLFSRGPSEKEQAAALQFLGESPAEAQWQQYAEVLLASNELMFPD